jgi:hypothetical protein
MDMKKLLLVGCMSMLSATCVLAQTLKNDYYQPSFTKSYDLDEEDAMSLYVDEDDKPSSFQRDAGLTLRNEKQTKRSSKKLERVYEKSAKMQKKVNRMQEQKIRKNERAYFREARRESKKV